ncbi:MAG: hypothetical protein ACI9FG_001776, partial [Crocinitomicaceae bacterium]
MVVVWARSYSASASSRADLLMKSKLKLVHFYGIVDLGYVAAE